MGFAKNKLGENLKTELGATLNDVSNLKKKVTKIDFYEKSENKKISVQRLFINCEIKIKNIKSEKKKEELQSELDAQKSIFTGVTNCLKDLKLVESDMISTRKEIIELNKEIDSKIREYNNLYDDVYGDYMRAYNLMEDNKKTNELNKSEENLDELLETAKKNLEYFKSEKNDLQKKWDSLVKRQNELVKRIDFLCEHITNNLRTI